MGSHRFVTLNLLGVLLGSTSTGWSQIVHNQTPRPRTVSGVVVNSVTKQPIPRALVEAGQHAMLTDDEGNFEFRDITENSAISANKPRYFPENAGTTTVWSSTGTEGPPRTPARARGCHIRPGDGRERRSAPGRSDPIADSRRKQRA
jgi:hypothetical protein